jgi:hypothetical protein
MNRLLPAVVSLLALTLMTAGLTAQQLPSARSGGPTYDRGTGPIVALDEAHKNAQRSDFRGLEELLQDDGYRVRRLTELMTLASLASVDVLVISNPGGWEQPSASLDDDEVSVVLDWVRGGGSLLLILDHAPGPLNAARLTEALGVPNWHNGYAMVEVSDSLPVGNIVFWRSGLMSADQPVLGPTGPGGGVGYQGIDAVLEDHPITEGANPDEKVRRVATFVGSAFEPPPEAEALLTMPRTAMSFTPIETPGALPEFTADTPRKPVGPSLPRLCETVIFGELLT